jgi:hypothetical protein
LATNATQYAAEHQRLRISHYDRASSWLISLLVTLGVLAVVLFCTWLSTIVHVPQLAVPVDLAEVGPGDGGGDGRAMGGSQLDSPSDEPFVGTDAVTEGVQESLSVLPDAIASKVLELDDPSLPTPKRHGSYGSGGGIGGGFGDGRGLGHGPGLGGSRRNWEVYFAKGSTLDLYAKQLDFFDIEMGVLQDSKTMIYAKGFASGKPTIRTGPPDQKRYNLTWKSGELQQAEKEILIKAGVQVGNRVIYKFLTPKTESLLAYAEKAYAGPREKEIKKTQFGVKQEGAGFEFTVLQQTYKK